MSRFRRSIPLLVALAAAGLLPAIRTVVADDEPEVKAADVYEQTDRKKIMSIKLPRSWKQITGENVDPKALISFMGYFGEEGKSPNAIVGFYVTNQFSRAVLARAVDLPTVGPLKSGSARSGPGWYEGAATDESRTDQHQAEWRRYVEKNGRVYLFKAICHDAQYEAQRETMQKILDTATVPGDYAPPAPGEGWKAKSVAEFDVLTDADADRESSIKKAVGQLGDSRQVVVKLLAGKPFDANRPVAWIFQNGSKFDDRAKAAVGSETKFALFSAIDRAAMVSIISEKATGHEEAVFAAGGQQYAWQYFGGEPPIWIDRGMGRFGQLTMQGGGKGKLRDEDLTKVRQAVVAGKRRLDQWFDVTSWNQVSDDEQGKNELFAWHWYFRNGKGAKKFKKQYDGYIATLRQTGDPDAARKSFDGVNFDEMLTDFKAWAADWK